MRLPSPSVAILRTQSDERLVALAREGHEAAFTAMVERYRRPMLAAARRFLPEARAEDAVQQTFVAAWKGLQRGDEVRELRPWLYRITRNTSLNALRTPGYDVAELQESLRVTEAPQDERREAIRRTLAGLAALPERQREALLRTAVEGAAHADVARDLGLTEGAARQLVMRARTTLRSAASVVLPFPVLQWLVASGATAGAGSAGAAATLAKAGAVVIVAGSAVATPVVVVDRGRDVEPAGARVPAAPARPAVTPAATAARTDVADELVTGERADGDEAAPAPERRTQRRQRRGRDRRDDGDSRSGQSSGSGPGSPNRGPGSSGGGGDDDAAAGDDSSGSDSGSSSSGSSDSGERLPGGDDSSGSGSGSSSSGSSDGERLPGGDDRSGSDSGSSGSDSGDRLPDAEDLDDSSGSGSGHD